MWTVITTTQTPNWQSVSTASGITWTPVTT